MKTLLRGEIVHFVPYFKADIRKNGLTLRNDGSISLTVDTGFSGGIALRENVLSKKREVETWFIPGDSLSGMEFLSIARKVLNVNFEKAIIELNK
jgi:hypothetical protein